MEGQLCSQPFDCGTQFKCVGGRCVPLPDCLEGDNGCESPNECLEASPAPQPDPDTPNCGIGDPNTDTFQVKDCIFNCNTFCDEWSKISANLTANTELKNCNIDDACSVCRTCEPGEGADDESKQALTNYYMNLISQVQQERADLLEEQEEEEDGLESEKQNELQPISDEIQRIQTEISDITPPSNSAEEDELDSLNQELSAQYILEAEVINRYIKLKEEMEKRHENALKLIDDYILQLIRELEERLKVLEQARGVCIDIPPPNRPCFCPAYIDRETEEVVDDANGRECYTCNIDSGSWEYRGDLCTVSCSKCVVCDTGIESCATVNQEANKPGDVCVLAQEKALAACETAPEQELKCPYPKPACDIQGPFPDSAFSYEIIDGNSLLISQGGDSPLSSNTGIPAVISVYAASSASGVYPITVNSKKTLINGSREISFDTVTGYVQVGGTEAPPALVTGLPKINGSSKTVGATVTTDLGEVEVADASPSWEYAWFADNVQLMTGPESTDPITTDTLVLTDDLVGKFLEVGIRLVDTIQYTRSNPFGLILGVADTYDAELTVFGNSSVYGAVEVNYSELAPYRPGIDPIIFSWIDLATGQSVGSGSYLYFSGPWAVGKTYYPVASFLDNLGETRTIQGPNVGPISSGTTPPLEDFDPTLPTGSVNLSTNQPVEDQIITASATINSPNGTSAGPFFQWYRNGEILPGYQENSITPSSSSIGAALACEVSIFDNYGGIQSFLSGPTFPTQNNEDLPTGFIYILGEPKVGSTLSTLNNIEDLDGIKKINYAWTANGAIIEDEKLPSLRISKSMEIEDSIIRVIAYYTDDYNVDKSIESNPTQPVSSDSAKITLGVGEALGVLPGEFFSLNLTMSGPTDSDTQITSILWQIDLGSNLLSWPTDIDQGNPEPARPGNLIDDAGWQGKLLECPEGWDCFQETLGPNGKETAPLGSSYHHKCPYPGYPELTFEESQSKDCKALCQDYCYFWSYTTSEGPPITDDDTVIVNAFKSGRSTLYVLETCLETDDCPRGWDKNYVAVFRGEYEGFDYWECSCEVPIGPKKTVNGTVEWHRSRPGVGPWKIDTDLPVDANGFYPLYYCLRNVSLGEVDCITNVLRRSQLCGGNIKSIPGRSFFVEDNKGNQTELNVGYSLATFPYRGAYIYQNLDGVNLFQYDVPPLPPERLPPQCQPAPVQVGYYDIRSNVFYTTRAIYDEFIEANPETMQDIVTADFRELSPSDALYPSGLMAIRPPAMPKREVEDLKIPTITDPASVTYSNGNLRTIANMQASITQTTAAPTGWRFTSSKSTTSTNGLFEVTAGGKVYALSADVPSNVYSLGLQALWDGIWSKSFVLRVTVLD